MSDRCDCPYPDPMTYGGPNPLCPEHGDPDAILASGRYVDRRGRTWVLVGGGLRIGGVRVWGVTKDGRAVEMTTDREVVRDEE